MINPYYDPGKLGLEMIAFDEPNLDYEYNIACFFANGNGQVYFATDSGCSCPTPFEDRYSGTTQAQCFANMERVENGEHARSLLKSWGKPYRGLSFITSDELKQVENWVNERTK